MSSLVSKKCAEMINMRWYEWGDNKVKSQRYNEYKVITEWKP